MTTTGPAAAGTTPATPTDLIASVRGVSGPALAEQLTEWIEQGVLAPGTRLPTIEEVAHASGLGRSTVAGTWSLLVDRGLVTTRRRGGTIVSGPTGAPTWPRAGEAPVFAGWSSVDLSSAHPTTDRLPDLLEAFAHSLREPQTNSLRREAITPALLDAVRQDWPFDAAEWVTVSGAGEATLLTAEAATAPGGLIAVQEPAVSGTIGNLRSVGFEVVGVASDAAGPLPDALERALAAGARTFVYQPGGEFSLEGGVTTARLAELAAVLTEHTPDAWVLEEDVLGPLAPVRPPSLGELLPGRVVRITSFCRAFGLDLRTTVVGGARDVVLGVRRLRSHGILAQSRILQNALAYLLATPSVGTLVADSGRWYADRGRDLARALAARDVRTATPPGGLVVWLRAENEDEALVELGARGIVLTPSSRTFVTPPRPAWLRVATPQIPADPERVEELAEALAGAARGALLAG
ncbi:aminotransferase class I/II-fold pyridoxal phosphate-dependent enzyme [Promicromonospora sukumoe]|uniref:aminotransferase class I/II-fold pyridoxal phosphate-dependent enzyme n=1 Tax=Promicromonospora sukumoe TaxID=88382 RepID=UPI0003741AA7|nr:aminotransferase class I/II-fold pyridoxal phosphate-dependent enzyme [Promicromonospora sukumoe]